MPRVNKQRLMKTLFRSFVTALTLLSLAFTAFAVERGARNNVPEAANYDLVYSLDIPDTPNYSNGVPYNIDYSGQISGFSRVAYYLELQQGTNPLKYIWVSMNAFTTNVNQIGVPTVTSGAFFQQPITNMNVQSSVAGIVVGTNLSGGNMEFWPQNYGLANTANVPNASGTIYDWGDGPYPGNYGSMQVHNHDAKQVLFAFNRWGGWGGVADLGIGNNPAGEADWTFATNAANYSIKTLQVYVLPNQEPFRIIAQGFESAGNFKVTCEARPGVTYSLWRKVGSATGAWTKVTEATAASMTMLLVDTQATNAAIIYQVRTP
jgi:cbb3-type cytochrome oxidase subunit 3